MAVAKLFVDTNDRVHTVLVAANVKAAIDDHASKIDAMDDGAGAGDLPDLIARVDAIDDGAGAGDLPDLIARVDAIDDGAGAGDLPDLIARVDDLDTAVTGRVSVNEADIAVLQGGGALLGYFEGDIGFADFTAEAGLETLAFDALSADVDAFLIYVWLEKVIDFAGGTINAATLEVGHDVGPDEDAFVLAEDVFTGAGAGKVGLVSAERGADQVAATYNPVLAATKKLTVTMRTTNGDVDELTSGTAKIHAIYRLL